MQDWHLSGHFLVSYVADIQSLITLEHTGIVGQDKNRMTGFQYLYVGFITGNYMMLVWRVSVSHTTLICGNN